MATKRTKRQAPRPIRYKLLSTCTVGGHELRFLAVNEENGAVSFPTSVEDMVRSCRENPGPCGAGACVYLPGQEECVKLKNPVSKLAIIERCGGRLLFLGSDVLTGTHVTRKNHIRVHTRYSKHGLATRLTLSGFKIEGINNSGTMWFYSIQGLFQVVFELHSRETQRDCLTSLQAVWQERYHEPPLKSTGLIRYNKRLKIETVQVEAHVDINSGKEVLPQIKSKLPLKKLVVVPDDYETEVANDEEERSLMTSQFSYLNDATTDFIRVETVTTSTSQGSEVGDFLERLKCYSDESATDGVPHQITGQILLALDYLKHISAEDEENVSDWGFVLFEMMDQFLATMRSEMYDDTTEDLFGLSRQKFALLYIVSEWLGGEYHKLASAISERVENFKKENLMAMDSLPPSESTIDMLFPSFMKQLLVNWIQEPNSQNEPVVIASAFADHTYSPPWPVKVCKVDGDNSERPLFPLVQLILEFATDSLVSGVAHVVYSRLRYAT